MLFVAHVAAVCSFRKQRCVVRVALVGDFEATFGRDFGRVLRGDCFPRDCGQSEDEDDGAEDVALDYTAVDVEGV